MSGSLDESQSKWNCEYCTYENWPSSLKCTMCRGAKPLLGEDIYRLRDPSPQRSNVASGPVSYTPSTDTYNLSPQNYSQNLPSGGKWSCDACTYLNYQNATRCVQCSTTKPSNHTQSINTASNLHEQLAPLRLGDPPPTQTQNSGQNTPIGNNLLASQPDKWSCYICTYENWPKSNKCIMCGHQREKDKRDKSNTNSGLIFPSPERDHSQRGLPSPPQSYIHQAQRDDNLAGARRSSHRFDSRNDSLPPSNQGPNDVDYESRLKQLRRHTDWCWLNACLGIVEGDNAPVEAYLASGGDPARQLTHSEVLLLNRSSAFDVGHTLVHLAMRFQREDILATLLSQIEGSGSGIKRVPSYVAPDLAAQIRRHVTNSIRLRKGSFPCYFVTDMATFALPAEVEDLPSVVQEQMLSQSELRMGQSSSISNHNAPRSSSAGTNNLPPLTFHQVHGENITLCNGGTIARRHQSFCKGITFSARPVRVGEKVCIKFLDLSNNWNGFMRFGFTSNDPVHLRNALPKYACPDLTNKPGYWVKALEETYAVHDAVLFYYVTSAGNVHFGVNGEEKRLFFSGVETRGPLWAVIDVYGNSTAIEFLDPNRQHFNNIRRSIEHSNEDNGQSSRHTAADDARNAERDVERIIVPSMQNVCLHHEADVELPGLRYQPPGVLFAPLPFHPVRGRNIRFSNQQCVATRNDTEFCHGYAFAGRPLMLGERLVVQVLATEPMYVGALALGLTSCDPSRLTPDDLPDDSDLLIDRPEYWVVSKDVASSPQPGDEIAFTVTHYGEVQMSKNGGPPNVVMHVDQSLPLWAFVDVYGSTQRVRMLASKPNSPPRQRQCAAQAPVPQQSQSNHANAATELSRFSEMVQFKPAVGGGTVLVVNLPPQPGYPNSQPVVAPQPIHPTPTSGLGRNSANFLPSTSATPVPSSSLATSSGQTPLSPVNNSNHHSARQSTSPPLLTGTMSSTGSSTYVDPVTYQSIDTSTLTSQSSHLQQWSEKLQPTPGQPSECSICYERHIDSVLYMCGHMCMCYPCAIQQWRGKGGGHCPLCRALIKDVIRIYKS